MPRPVLAKWTAVCDGSLGSSAHVSYLQPMTLTTFQGESYLLPQQLLPTTSPACAAPSTDAEQQNVHSGGEALVRNKEKKSLLSLTTSWSKFTIRQLTLQWP